LTYPLSDKVVPRPTPKMVVLVFSGLFWSCLVLSCLGLGLGLGLGLVLSLSLSCLCLVFVLSWSCLACLGLVLVSCGEEYRHTVCGGLPTPVLPPELPKPVFPPPEELGIIPEEEMGRKNGSGGYIHNVIYIYRWQGKAKTKTDRRVSFLPFRGLAAFYLQKREASSKQQEKNTHTHTHTHRQQREEPNVCNRDSNKNKKPKTCVCPG
jgi:hypothetical protein